MAISYVGIARVRVITPEQPGLPTPTSGMIRENLLPLLKASTLSENLLLSYSITLAA